MSGLTITGGLATSYVPAGVAEPLLAQLVVSDSVSSSLAATIQIYTPVDMSLSDPNAAVDGSFYDSANGVFTVSGTAAQVTAALQGLLFAPAAGAGGLNELIEVQVTDSLGHSTGTSGFVRIVASTTYDGGGQSISPSSGSPTGLSLASTGGIEDTVVAPDDDLLDVSLDSAQASVYGSGYFWLNHTGNALALHAPSPYNASFAYGDDGIFTLYDSFLTVYGDNARVAFSNSQTQNAIAFYGPTTDTYKETVDGSFGTINATNVSVQVTGDYDAIHFGSDGEVLDMTAKTKGAWNALYATNGVVDLHGASLSIVGGAMMVNAVSGANAVSLYQTYGVDDSVDGDDMSITLNNAQAVVNGGNDTIWFVGGSASIVGLNLQASQYDTAYGAGTINLNGGTVFSVGGGALVNFATEGGLAYLSYTEGVWDQVQGAGGTTVLQNAQVVVYGGNQIVNFLSGIDDAATLTQTDGNWDVVYGYGRALTIDDAQVNVLGGFDDIYMMGSGDAISLYVSQAYAFGPETVHGDDTTVMVDTYNIRVDGGGNTVYLDPSLPYVGIEIAGTNGVWDILYGQSQSFDLLDAQASVFGGSNSISLDAGCAVSIYDTGGDIDEIQGNGAAITLNDAGADLFGDSDYVYFAGAANSINLSSSIANDVLTFVGAFGLDTITSFGPNDVLALAHWQFANFQAFAAAFTQQGFDAVLTLDANDKVTFVGLQTSAVTQAQVTFV